MATSPGVGADAPRMPTAPIPAQRPSAARRSPFRSEPALLYWQTRYSLAVRVADVAVVATCVAAGIALKASLPQAAFAARLGSGIVAGVLLLVGLQLGRAWEARILGTGSTEMRRVSNVFASAAIGLALLGLAFKVDSVRGWVFGIIPACWALCLLTRYALRRIVHHRRGFGRCQLPVLAVGSAESVADLVARTRRDPWFGWRVDAACTTSGDEGHIDNVPVIGDLDDVIAGVHSADYRVVAVGSTPGWGPGRLRELGWQLEDTAAELAVDPGLMEIAGPRLHITPVDGFPLLRLSEPRFTGTGKFVKGLLDRLFTVVLLLLLLPVLVAVAVAVKLDGGPVFYRQARVGIARPGVPDGQVPVDVRRGRPDA